MARAMPASTGGTIWAPLSSYTLYPLSRGGLWLAVITTAAAAPAARATWATSGVGVVPSKHRTANPAPPTTATASSAKRRLSVRPSYPTTTRRP